MTERQPSPSSQDEHPSLEELNRLAKKLNPESRDPEALGIADRDTELSEALKVWNYRVLEKLGHNATQDLVNRPHQAPSQENHRLAS